MMLNIDNLESYCALFLPTWTGSNINTYIEFLRSGISSLDLCLGFYTARKVTFCLGFGRILELLRRKFFKFYGQNFCVFMDFHQLLYLQEAFRKIQFNVVMNNTTTIPTKAKYAASSSIMSKL